MFRVSEVKHKEATYNGFEVLNFRCWQYLQDQSDVFKILRESPNLSAELDELTHMYDVYELFRCIWGLTVDILRYRFWNNVQSDLPWQLDESIRSEFSKLELANVSLAPRIGQQLLSRHLIYSNAVRVRDYFRCFPRDDGSRSIRHNFAVLLF